MTQPRARRITPPGPRRSPAPAFSPRRLGGCGQRVPHGQADPARFHVAISRDRAGGDVIGLPDGELDQRIVVAAWAAMRMS